MPLEVEETYDPPVKVLYQRYSVVPAVPTAASVTLPLPQLNPLDIDVILQRNCLLL
jgi:hypothetical protein